MSLLGSIAKFAIPIALTVVTGGAAAPALATLQQLAVKAAVQIAIQQAGQQLGLPPQAISFVSSAAMGQIGGANADFSQASGNAINYPGSQNDFMKSYADLMAPSAAGNMQRGICGLGDCIMREVNSDFSTNPFSGGTSGQVAANDQRLSTMEDQLANMKPGTKQYNQLERRIEKLAESNNGLKDILANINTRAQLKKLEGEINDVKASKMSVLMKIAIIMGKIADNKMNQMAAKAEQLGDFGKVKQSNQGKFSELNAEMNALGQEFGLISGAISNVIKSIGEGQSTIARK